MLRTLYDAMYCSTSPVDDEFANNNERLATKRQSHTPTPDAAAATKNRNKTMTSLPPRATSPAVSSSQGVQTAVPDDEFEDFIEVDPLQLPQPYAYTVRDDTHRLVYIHGLRHSIYGHCIRRPVVGIENIVIT